MKPASNAPVANKTPVPSLRMIALTLATLALSFFSLSGPSRANAQCGGYTHPASYQGSLHSSLNAARLLNAAYTPANGPLEQLLEPDPIVGLWHVHFIAKGNPEKSGPPDGAEIDAGFVVWHSDGTEIMNSGGRSPVTSAFCLGTWAKANKVYKLNHFAISWDPTGTFLVGPANIKEEVTLSRDGDSYKGPFSITQYDEKGNILAHVVGVLNATRVTVDTPSTSVF